MQNEDLDSLKWEVNRHVGGGWLRKHGPERYGGDRRGAGIWPFLLFLALVAALWAIE